MTLMHAFWAIVAAVCAGGILGYTLRDKEVRALTAAWQIAENALAAAKADLGRLRGNIKTDITGVAGKL